MAVSVETQIDVAASLVRLYVLLSQYLDRCLDEASRKSFPEKDLQGHLTETRRHLLDLLSVNPVVKKKVGEEYDRILAIGAECVTSGSASGQPREAIQAERAVLRTKSIALSDLVAVYRALS